MIQGRILRNLEGPALYETNQTIGDDFQRETVEIGLKRKRKRHATRADSRVALDRGQPIGQEVVDDFPSPPLLNEILSVSEKALEAIDLDNDRGVQLDEAIKVQSKAVELAEGDPRSDEAKKSLAEYLAAAKKRKIH